MDYGAIYTVKGTMDYGVAGKVLARGRQGTPRVVQRGLGPSQVDNGQCKWTMHESGAAAESGVYSENYVASV